MAKWKSPIFSDIRNKLGENVVFSMWNGRQYMRSYTKPANPKTTGQTANRLHMANLVGYWQANIATVSAAVTSWNKAALSDLISGFNRFVKGGRGFVISGVTLAYASFAFTVDSVSLPLNEMRYAIVQSGAPSIYYGATVTLGAQTATSIKGTSVWSPSPDDLIYVVDTKTLDTVELSLENVKKYAFPLYFVDEATGAATLVKLTT